MVTYFDELYPNIAWWAQGDGWIELGRDDCGKSLIRVLDIGGMLWEGEEQYDSAGDAMDEAERFIAPVAKREWLLRKYGATAFESVRRRPCQISLQY